MCIGKERPAVSSCDVTQAPCGRPGNGDGQVDNASNPSSRIWILFSNLLEYFFSFFDAFVIHNIRRKKRSQSFKLSRARTNIIRKIKIQTTIHSTFNLICFQNVDLFMF